ncbi:drug resistance transporter, EmrB/QacA subfamily [Ferrithrix thermotolerans DSM 19514]|uniref:Drug resistance transporter, EmrB/QacA subfamily n=1 Tax=Ferrithrix thermotolerans DSM 19514 TaxID=1121881 RepID=A0A1M4XXW4_9ACTN|nr:MFS transporter [Ferrithrix thermotolerans]SHE98279.1 drug resistance transporter, EmrB/QacA subfamily [Ferrithrix thermotolerans DSM 19514]
MSRAIKEHKGLILLLACIGQFMVILDVSIVNVALPAIKTSLGFTDSELQWILNAYTLTFAGLLLLGGRVADIFGRRKVFMAGLAIFTVASLVGAVSTDRSILILARAIQGLGGAILSPATLTILTTTFSEGKERARALGIWSAVAGAGGAAGALLGGVLTDLLSWRWIFLINLPIGALAAVITFLYLSELKRSSGSKTNLDVLGSVLITFSVTALVYALVEGGTSGWSSSTTLISFGVSALTLLYFLVHEGKVAKSPIVPLGMFRLKKLSVANVTMFFVGGSVFASWYFLSLFMQQILGYSPLKAGLAFVPQTLAIATGAQVSSRLIPKVGVRPLIVVGPIVSGVGLLLFHGISIHSSYLHSILLPSVLTTLGVGLSFTPLAVAATSGVERSLAGLASGLLNTARQVGGAVGLAGLSSIALSFTGSDMKALLSHGAISLHRAALVASAAGYAHSLEISAAIALVAAAFGAFLGGRGNRNSSDARESLSVDSNLGVEGI